MARCFLDRRPGHDRVGRRAVEPTFQLLPEPLVRPILDRLVEGALKVEPAAGARAHRAQGKAALVADIDQLGGDRRGVAQDAEPAKRIDALVGAECGFRDGLPADTVKAVAPGDEIARDFARDAVAAVAQARPPGGDIVQAYPVGLVEGRHARSGARLHQVAGDLGLAVNGDGLAGQLAEIDALPPSAKADLDAVMNETLAMKPVADAGAVEQTDRPVLDQAGANTAQHIFAAALLENDVGDAVDLKQLPEEQAGRAGADDRDLGAHVSSAPEASRCSSGGSRRSEEARRCRWPPNGRVR